MDEVLLEVDKGMGVEVGKVMCECYTQAGVELHNYYTQHKELYSGGDLPKIVCDFSGGYAIGPSYAEVH